MPPTETGFGALFAERLETRLVLTGGITTFTLSPSTLMPQNPTVGPDGAIWFTEQNAIGRIDHNGNVAQFPMPQVGINPGSLTAGSDGNLWFTEAGLAIGQMTPSGTVSQYSLPAGNGAPSHLTLGPDGNIWFTEKGAQEVGQITLQGTITEFPEGDSAPATATSITSGPDGNLWITEAGIPAIAEMTTTGTVTRYPINAVWAGPNSIASGRDGNLWFADPVQGVLGKITTSGTIQDFPISPAPDMVAQGPDAVYFLSPGGYVGRIASSGIVTGDSKLLFSIQDSGIVAGTDGDLWVTQQNLGQIVRIEPDLLGAHGAVSVSTTSVTATAGQSFAGASLGIVTTAESLPNAANYTATINWGDGTAPSTGKLSSISSSSANNYAPGLAIFGDHDYAKPGNYTIAITVTGTDHSTASGIAKATVAPEVISLAPVAISAQTGVDSGTIVLANGSGVPAPAISHMSATVDWGDGSSSTNATLVPMSGSSGPTFKVEGDHTYAARGNYTVTVNLVSTTGASASSSGMATASSSPVFQVSGVTQASATSGVIIDSRPLAILTTTDPNPLPSDFSATINWGDGSTQAGTIVSVLVPATATVPAHNVIEVDGGHTYASAGTFAITVSVTRFSGNSATASDSIVVAKPQTSPPPPPPPPVVLPNGHAKKGKASGHKLHKSKTLKATAKPKHPKAHAKTTAVTLHAAKLPKKHNVHATAKKHPHGPLK